MQLTQVSLQRLLIDLINDEDWGEPKDYDITITKKGEGKNNTSYTLTPKDAELSDGVKKVYKKMNIDLELLLENKDPFNPDGEDDDDDEDENEENPFDEEDDE